MSKKPGFEATVPQINSEVESSYEETETGSTSTRSAPNAARGKQAVAADGDYDDEEDEEYEESEDNPAATAAQGPGSQVSTVRRDELIQQVHSEAASSNVSDHPAAGLPIAASSGNRTIETLEITLHSATGLANADGLGKGKSDPFAEITIPGQKKQKTKTVDNTLEPVWNFVASYNATSLGSGSQPITAKIEVFDEDTVSNDFLGRCQLRLSTQQLQEAALNPLKLPVALYDAKDNPGAGTLQVTVRTTGTLQQHACPDLLQVTISRAVDLKSKDGQSKSDPYVVIETPGHPTFKTEVVNDSDHPVWNHIVTYQLNGNPNLTLKATVFDSDVGKDDFVGCTEFPVNEAFLQKALEAPQEVSSALVPEKQGAAGNLGRIFATFQAVHAESVAGAWQQKGAKSKGAPPDVLNLKLVRAVGLKKMDTLGKADPYVVVTSKGEDPQQTAIVKSSLDPAWNHVMSFDLRGNQPRTFTMTVYDADEGSSDELMGTATLVLDENRLFSTLGNPTLTSLPVSLNGKPAGKLVVSTASYRNDSGGSSQFYSRMSSAEFAQMRKEKAAQQEAVGRVSSLSKLASQQKIGIRVSSSDSMQMVPDGGVAHSFGDVERSTQYPPTPSTPLEQPKGGSSSQRPLGRIRKVSASPARALSEPKSMLSEDSFAHSPGLGGRGGYRAESPENQESPDFDNGSLVARDRRERISGMSTSPYRSRTTRNFKYGQPRDYRSPATRVQGLPQPVPETTSPSPYSPVFASDTLVRGGSQGGYHSPTATGVTGPFTHASPTAAKSPFFANFLSRSSVSHSPRDTGYTRYQHDTSLLASTSAAYTQVRERTPTNMGEGNAGNFAGSPHLRTDCLNCPHRFASSESPHKDWQPSSFGKTICKCRSCLRAECQKLISYTVESAHMSLTHNTRKR